MIKRTIAALLVLMIAVFAVPSVFADGETGSITVNDATNGKTYSAYRIFDLESYNVDSEAYVYKTNTKWSAFINGTDVKGVYVTIDEQGYVSWVKDADEAAFAKLAKAYASANGTTMTPDATAVASGGVAYMDNLPLGYYLVDSPLGALCGLNTTNPDIEINEKNEIPSIEKKVESADGSNVFGNENHAKIGDTVSFRITVTAQPGAESYVVHDKMDPGLTFKSITRITSRREDATTPTTVDASNYSVVTTGLDQGCSYEISFTKAFLDTITAETKINIYYTAELNENATHGETDPNTNESWLTYGDGNTTVSAKTDTYTYMFELVKTDAAKKVISGAKFELYDNQGNKVSLVKDTAAGGNTYRVATPEQKAADGFTSAIIEAGNAKIIGLIAGNYSLKEITPPAGYNKLDNDFAFTLSNKDEAAVISNGVYQNGGVNVINQKGTMLPQTGGTGTAIFYIAGTILAAGSGILLIARKRML